MKAERTLWPLILTVLLAFAVGCSDDPVSPPPPALISIDSLWTFETDSVFYGCGTWSPAAPQQTRGLFDVYFGGSFRGMPLEHPLEEHRESIRRAGGIIVYEFQLAKIRTLIATDSIPAIRPHDHVHGVPDWEEYLSHVGIGFESKVTQDDLDYLVSLGTEITGMIESQYAVFGNVPDAAIYVIRGNPRVLYVSGGSNGCPF